MLDLRENYGSMLLICIMALSITSCAIPVGAKSAGTSKVLIVGFGYVEKNSDEDSIAGITHSTTIGSEIEFNKGRPIFMNVGYARRSQVYVKKGVENITIERKTYKTKK